MVARHGLDGGVYQAEFDRLTALGHLLIDISGYVENGHLRYTAIWRQASSPAWQARHGLDAQAYQTAFDPLSGQGRTVTFCTETEIMSTPARPPRPRWRAIPTRFRRAALSSLSAASAVRQREPQRPALRWPVGKAVPDGRVAHRCAVGVSAHVGQPKALRGEGVERALVFDGGEAVSHLPCIHRQSPGTVRYCGNRGESKNGKLRCNCASACAR